MLLVEVEEYGVEEEVDGHIFVVVVHILVEELVAHMEVEVAHMCKHLQLEIEVYNLVAVVRMEAMADVSLMELDKITHNLEQIQ